MLRFLTQGQIMLSNAIPRGWGWCGCLSPLVSFSFSAGEFYLQTCGIHFYSANRNGCCTNVSHPSFQEKVFLSRWNRAATICKHWSDIIEAVTDGCALGEPPPCDGLGFFGFGCCWLLAAWPAFPRSNKTQPLSNKHARRARICYGMCFCRKKKEEKIYCP